MAGAFLYTDPSANKAREYFKTKPRSLTDKVTTVADAVARLVNDGDYLGIGGFGCARIPTAVLHEILRQQKQNLSMAATPRLTTFKFYVRAT